ncbi:MAG: hypothetical protein KJZ92_15485 [Rhodocyclaceae bacterium]|nr:hypothetical protein [Opitutaceae bacterium]MCL4682655.1 hypothetical protein [Rhodocyclaceae bacterium]
MRYVLAMIAALLGSAIPGASSAFTLGTPEVLTRQGEPLRLRVPLNLTGNETGVRVALAAEGVYAALGYFYPQSLRNANAEVKDAGGKSVIEITGGAPRGPLLPVVMDISTNTGSVVRHFTVQLPEQGAAQSTATPSSAPAVKRAQVTPTVASGSAQGSFAIQDMIIQQRIDSIKEAETEVASKIDGLNNTVTGLVTSIAISMDDTRKVQESINRRLEERFSRDDLTWFAGSAVIGFVIAMLLFGGRRKGLQAGMRVRLVGHGQQPIEGEFVRLVTDKNKPLAYRIADMMSGVPKTMEIRALADDRGPVVEEAQHPQQLDNFSRPETARTLALEPIAEHAGLRH